jgi:hypothetical protein
MPAKPRPRLGDRLVEEARRPRLAFVGFRDRVAELFDRDLVDRDLLELERLGDLFRLDRLEDPLELDRFALVSPFSCRILLTVLAATSSVRPPYRPDFLALCLMCSYCRSRFGLAPRGI